MANTSPVLPVDLVAAATFPMDVPNAYPRQSTLAQLLGGGANIATLGAGVVELNRSGAVQQSLLTLTNVVFPLTHGVSGCFGFFDLYTFQEGLIQILGAVADLTMVSDANIGATPTLLFGVGTAHQTDAATLNAASGSVIPSSSNVFAASAAIVKVVSTATQMAAGMFDGSTTPIVLSLNGTIAANPPTGNITVNGTIRVNWAWLGDK